MSTESRRLPSSNTGRNRALNRAKQKNDAMGASSFLTAPTQAELNIKQAQYQNGLDQIAVSAQALGLLSIAKNEQFALSEMFISHFFQVFNLGIKRGKYSAADRAFYKLDVSSDAVPPLVTGDDLLEWGYNIKKGEADRVAAGGTPMVNPSAAEVDAVFVLFNDAFVAHNTATEALDQKREVIENHNAAVDKLIKKIWNEVETFYGDEEPESMRQNARLWGVVYDRQGGTKTISGKVTDAVSGLPVEGILVKLEGAINKATTNAAGEYSFTTTMMDEQVITATPPKDSNYQPYAAEITLTEGQNLTHQITLLRK